MSEYKKKFVLDEERIPKAWYNIVADLPEPPAPPLNPATMKPAGPEDLLPSSRPASSSRRCRRSATSRSPRRSARSTASGGRRR